MNRQETLNLIRDTVDPMLLKLRHDLFGSAFGGSIRSVLVSGGSGGSSGGGSGGEPGTSSPIVYTYNAGGSGVQKGKVVYFDGIHVHHADSTSVQHAGLVVGVAAEAAGPGAQVKVQAWGELDISDTGVTLSPVPSPLFIGTAGSLSAALPPGVTFVQGIAIAVASQKVFIMLNPDVFMV